ncbi:MAG TPA: hypothetical protein VH089_03370 [Streptosporangiaceae bacterium]|nr:hypothetical protein [Streptosporangiaceae bacterium]
MTGGQPRSYSNEKAPPVRGGASGWRARDEGRSHGGYRQRCGRRGRGDTWTHSQGGSAQGARILSAVFFAINTLDALVALFLVRDSVATEIIGAVIWLIGLAAIVLLFSKDSRPFYNQGADLPPGF